jgi:sugar/nucleoside kinase (ribokinase family)
VHPEILFVGDTTYDFLGSLKEDIGHSSYNELTATGRGFGGKAANAAVYCANLGVRTAYVGTVGNDFESIGYKKYLETRSVDIKDVFYTERSTPLFFSFRAKERDYIFFTRTKRNEQETFKYKYHIKNVLKSRNWEIVYCAFSDMEILYDIFREARVKNRQTAWNPVISSFDRKLVEQILSETDFLLVNEYESKILEKELSLDFSEIYTKYNIRVICVTLGEKGCKVFEKGAVTNISTIKVEVVDTVGAGDAFAGTFLASYLLFGSARICAELACLAGSNVVQNFGTQIDNVPTLAQLFSLRANFYET